MIHHIYTPKTGWVMVDDSLPVENVAPYIGGTTMSDKSVRDCKQVFTREDRKRGRNRTVKDVDRALDTFGTKYPHLKRPDRIRRDPFPDVDITDRLGNHAE